MALEKRRFDERRSGFKGISPLIAAVLLIAFTMAIAGIMATWATTFSKERLQLASEEADCVGALDLSSLSFNNGTVSVRVRNVGTAINLTGMVANIEYSDTTKNKQYIFKELNFTDSIQPALSVFFNVDTLEPAKPLRVEVASTNCPREPSVLFFR